MGQTRVPALSEQLRQAIRDDGRTLGQLARATGVDTPRLSRFVRGERRLTLPAVDAVAAALGLRLVKPGRKKGGKP